MRVSKISVVTVLEILSLIPNESKFSLVDSLRIIQKVPFVNPSVSLI